MKKTAAIVCLILLSACSHEAVPPATAGQCPAAFWVPQNVADEFKKYPEGSPMREFFKSYVNQQRAIDQYYSPMSIRQPQ